jgi:hypothetical protein
LISAAITSAMMSQVHPSHAPYPIIVHHGFSLRLHLAFSSDRLIAFVLPEALVWLLTEQNDIVSLGCAALHPRRTDRHAGNRKTTAGWFLRDEPPDGMRGYVSLDHISTGLGGVARGKIAGSTEARLDLSCMAAVTATVTTKLFRRRCSAQPVQQPQFGSFQTWMATRDSACAPRVKPIAVVDSTPITVRRVRVFLVMALSSMSGGGLAN